MLAAVNTPTPRSLRNRVLFSPRGKQRQNLHFFDSTTRHVELWFLNQGWNPTEPTAVEAWSINYWTTREVPLNVNHNVFPDLGSTFPWWLRW